VADESRVADPLAAILKDLRLMEKEMAANKAEFDQKLVDLTQNPCVYRKRHSINR
jgi:hypothetical protein